MGEVLLAIRKLAYWCTYSVRARTFEFIKAGQELSILLRVVKLQERKIAMGSWNSNDCTQREEEDDGQGSNITSKEFQRYSCYYSARIQSMQSWSSEDFQSDEEDDGQNTGQDQLEKQESGISDEFLTAHDSWSWLADEIPGSTSSNPRTPFPSSSSVYYSERIQSMMENRGKFKNELEFQIESSKVHWSELDPTWQAERHSREMNRKYFKELKFKQDKFLFWEKEEVRFWGQLGLFREMDDLKVGCKIAEGSQAEIYEAYNLAGNRYVVKVFKADSLLRDLEKQWPPGMLYAFRVTHRFGSLCTILCATLLKDKRFLDRFAFVMKDCWGDLRKLIDLQMMQMIQSSIKGPPFTTSQVLWFMFCIADDMFNLHTEHPPILHRDLKAANVLVHRTTFPLDLAEVGSYKVTVADFECSVGVVGSGFWRAPEIFQQLKNRVPCSKMEFTEKCDVYSFGMTCYELVTGRIPFEGHSLRDYDLVLNGNRPDLPPDLDPLVKGIITSCWHPDPSQRPDFNIITRKLLKAGATHHCGNS